MAKVIPAVTKLSSRVIRILGFNPGPMTLQGTNTYLLGTGRSRILVDTGSDDVPQYITQLRHVLKHESCTVSDVVVTHWHADHLGGLPHVLGNLPSSHHKENIDCRVWKHPGDRPTTHVTDEHVQLSDLSDGQVISVEGATIRVIHTPGHSDDHVVLLLEEENALLSGDCVLGEGTTVFEDLHEYMQSLHKILELKPALIYPGHGNIVTDPSEKIRWYIEHRMERERQIMAVLKKEKGEAMCSKDIVERVYVDTPERLLPAADVNVRHHLVKLAKENKVHHTTDDKWTCIATSTY